MKSYELDNINLDNNKCNARSVFKLFWKADESIHERNEWKRFQK